MFHFSDILKKKPIKISLAPTSQIQLLQIHLPIQTHIALVNLVLLITWPSCEDCHKLLSFQSLKIVHLELHLSV